MTQNIKAIIFDCDGTLVDSEHAHHLAWQHAIYNQGYNLTLEEYYFFVGNPAEFTAKILAKKFNKDCFTNLLQDKLRFYDKLQKEGLPPIESTVNFVRHLASKKTDLNLKLAIASAASQKDIMTHLKHLNIDHLFDIIISGKDDLGDYFDIEGTNKPKPYIYLHTAKILGIAPSQCIVIEDSKPGVCAGVDAGCFTVAIPNKFTLDQDLSRAHVKLTSFDNIDINNLLQMAVNFNL